MKSRKNSISIVMFLAGAVAGVTLTGLFAFTRIQNAGSPAEPAMAITADQAHILVGNHVKANVKLDKVVEGLAIDTAQFNAMKSILTKEPETAAFRIYLGLANGKDKIGIVVGMDKTGKELLTNIIMTPLTLAGPCPTVCDKASPIYYPQ